MTELVARKSSPRLQGFAYEGPDAYMLTLNTQSHQRHFADRRVVQDCTHHLYSSAARHGFTILAYCFMPDHLHLLVQASDGSRLVSFVQHFKQVTGYGFRRRTGQKLWQRSFFDHVVRKEEDLREIADYIWGNPVRAGLVESREAYPFSGPFGQT
jgi:putative transposase